MRCVFVCVGEKSRKGNKLNHLGNGKGRSFSNIVVVVVSVVLHGCVRPYFYPAFMHVNMYVCTPDRCVCVSLPLSLILFVVGICVCVAGPGTVH